MTSGDHDSRGTAPGARFANLGTRSGTILGRYELVRRIGTGGMAEVYEAVHRGLKKTVAVKVLLPETAANPDLVARFLREGEAASRIQHPHVVDVTDVGEDNGVAYLVMEFLEGQSLSQLLSSSTHGRLSVARTLDILLPIATALEEAHAQGVVHRDLKPENVFIARSSSGKAIPKILDFGVSKLSGGGIPSTTAVSSVLGTPHYMSPEQARGEGEIDGRADQYSYALMIYECITGTLPFRSDNVVALIHEVIRGVTMPPSTFVPDLPHELDAILLKALSSQPDDRYPSVAVLGELLLPFATSRAKETFGALIDKEPRSQPNSLLPPPPPAEITGTFGPVRASPRAASKPAIPHPTPTVALRRGVPNTPPRMDDVPTVPPAPSAELAAVTPSGGSPAPRSRAVWVGALVLLLIGVSAGALWLSMGPAGSDAAAAAGTTPLEPHGETGATAPPGVVPRPAPPSVVPPPAIAVEPTEVPPAIEEPAAPARMHVALVTEPSTATIELDGEPVGVGTLEQWMTIDGETHRLVVRAPGYLERTLELTDEPPPLRVVLERAAGRPARPDRPEPPTGGDVRRPPPPDDEDIRSSR